MPSRVAVEVYGARELRTSLRRMQVEGAGKALRQTHQKIAKFVEGRTRGKGTPQQQAAARALLGKGSQKSADLKIRNLASVPFGIAAFMGAERQTGWYAASRYNFSTGRQFPEWVGNNWNLEAGIGPYVIADQIKRDRQEILDTYLEELAATANALGLQFQ